MEQSRTPTIGDVLDANRGIGPGFNFLRMALSAGVILLHSFHTAYGLTGYADWLRGPLNPPFASLLVLFFGLSGFLVTGSAIRTASVKTFLVFRALRLVPALLVEITLSALLLGPLLTSLPWRDYFASPLFYTYFGNVIGWIHFSLPGMFLNNPMPGIVNKSLWTLHAELKCYAIMTGLMVFRLLPYRNRMTVAWVLLTILGVADSFFSGRFELQGTYGPDTLVYYFVTAIVAYHWRHHIPRKTSCFVGALVTTYILLRIPHTMFLVVYPMIYIMMFVGTTALPKWNLIERGDYSYGLYLYAYPVQQTIAYLFPQLREWYIIFPLALVISYCIAAVSWHYIEKPALKLKKRFGGRVMQNPVPVPAAEPTGELPPSVAPAIAAAQ